MVLVLGMREPPGFLEQWQLDAGDLRRRMYWAPTPRERERWHALWLLVQGWTAVAVAEALGRDAHTIGRWVAVFGEGGPGRCLRAVGWFPPAIDGVQQTELQAVVQEFPAKVGLDLANWTLRQAQEEGGAQICAGTFRGLPEPPQLPELPPSTRGQALHRLGFVLKRPQKRLLKADAAKRETFVAEYAALVDEAQQVGAKVFCVDEAHFRADADPVSGYGTGSEGQMGAQKESQPWWTRPARAGAKRPAIIRRCAWKPARWNGWNWRATATLQPPPLSCGNCGSSTRDR